MKIGTSLKGVWHEICDFRFFSWISFPWASELTIGGHFEFLRIFTEIFEVKVKKTGDKWKQFWGGFSFIIFTVVVMLLGCILHSYNDFLLIVHFEVSGKLIVLQRLTFHRRCQRHRSVIIAGVVSIGDKSSPVSLLPAINYSPVSWNRSKGGVVDTGEQLRTQSCEYLP
jgi:hypothetical protein